MKIDLATVNDRLRDRILAKVRAEDAAKGGRAAPVASVVPGPEPGKRIRQSRDGLNKLESAFYRVLKAQYPAAIIRPQAKRFRVGGTWYKPDFVGIGLGLLRETAWEVKGPHAFRGGFENLKNAAALWPEVDWVLVWRDGDGHWRSQWLEKTDEIDHSEKKDDPDVASVAAIAQSIGR